MVSNEREFVVSYKACSSVTRFSFFFSPKAPGGFRQVEYPYLSRRGGSSCEVPAQLVPG